jgi:septum formation protein
MSKLILASASPRRRELLTQAGYVFEVCPAHIPEEPQPGEDAVTYVIRLAREKAEAVYRQAIGNLQQGTEDWGRGLEGLGTEPNDIVVLGADTTVTIDGQILEKPRDAEDAARMLRLLSGRTHRVITGVAVVSEGVAQDDVGEGEHGMGRAPRIPPLRQEKVARMGHGAFGAGPVRVEVAAEVTAVRFLTLRDEEIAAYVAGGEPRDKAGAYAIQGRAARWIPRIEGCYFNVVGLPLALVAEMLDGVRNRGRDRE